MNRIGRASARGLAAAMAIALAVVAASAETAWVKDELRLNLRTGPGSEYRIKGYIKTGDSVTVLAHREGWVQVRTSSSDLGDGWIEDGFLGSDPPAAMRLDRMKNETDAARNQFGSLAERVKQLEAENGKLSDADTAQKKRLEELTHDNMELRAGARWPEWITGASVLAVGMLMGAIVQSANGRRARPRIRL
jgi:SH3 domain protein